MTLWQAIAFDAPQQIGTSMFAFDGTITMGAVINALVLIVGFTIAFTRLGNRIDLLNQRLTAVENYMREARDTNARIAVIETRQATHGQFIALVQQEMRDLKHGDGFVIRGREYPPPA
jgi:hypothetical protein